MFAFQWRFQQALASRTSKSALSGAGGMGEVYKARDTRLNRTVALKVLPPDVAGNTLARQRLEQEARAIAAVTDSRICTLHDVGHHDGIDFLVMEYLEGETLADRLRNRGAAGLRVDEALGIAIEVAQALAAAHRQGIVHRDLKPSNIVLTSAGPKLLDFGIAKLREGAGPSRQSDDGVTVATPATIAGSIMGTPQYLAPEQVGGGHIDARTDIFAFGAILYEMLAGRRAFDGRTNSEIFAAVLAEPPSLKAARAEVPTSLAAVVGQCLARQPDDRWQSARDLALHLRAIAANDLQVPALARGNRPSYVTLAAAMALTSLLTALLVWRQSTSTNEAVFLDIAPPPDTSLLTTSASIPAAQFAVSPDGRYVTFVAVSLNGQPSLWLRELATGVTRRLSGSEGASYPFWSRDSASIGFFAQGQLLRTDLDGSPPFRVCQAIDPRGGAWNADNVIVFALSRGALFRVQSRGGVPVPATTLDTARGEITHRWPSFLPDGKRLIYLARGGDHPALRVSTLDGGTTTTLVESMFSGAVVSSGHLLFQRDGALLVQPLDLDRLQLSAEPMVVTHVVGTSSVGQLAASASASGVLVFATDLSAPGQLTWFDRQGTVLGSVSALADNMDFELAPDDKRLLISRVESRTYSADIWLMDLARGNEARLTTDVGIEASAIFDPTGSRVAFRSNRGGVADTYLKDVASSAPERLIFRGISTNPTSWSPDGGRILYNESDPETGWDILQFTFEKSTTAAFIKTQANELHGRFSPDGLWIAYSSDESGRWEVYVRRTDGRGERVLLSTNGGFEPRWRGDGKEIFYVTAERRIMAVAVAAGATFQAATPRVIVTAQIDSLPTAMTVSSGYRKTYTVTADGQRFLVNVLAREQNTQTMTAILNWPALLQRSATR